MRLILGLVVFALCLSAAGPASHNLILITADGLRWQEVFRGIDPLLTSEKSAGMEKADDRRRKYERPTDEERRQALMPFFWTKIAPQAAVFSNVHVTNQFRVSYPGYSEILTGRAEDNLIRDNSPIRNPNETSLEFLRRKLRLQREQVALFASWETFHQIGEHTEGSIFINAGYQPTELRRPSPLLADLSRIQFDVLTPWDEARHDFITGALALEYMRVAKPRVLFVSFDETDDWAHGHRYDRVLDAIAEFDNFLERLWRTIDSMKEYRGRTTVIITSDHGRGSTVADWNDHGKSVEGAGRVWLAIAGPQTRANVESGEIVEQRDIAPTMIRLMGVDAREYSGTTGKPIVSVLAGK